MLVAEEDAVSGGELASLPDVELEPLEDGLVTGMDKSFSCSSSSVTEVSCGEEV